MTSTTRSVKTQIRQIPFIGKANTFRGDSESDLSWREGMDEYLMFWYLWPISRRDVMVHVEGASEAKWCWSWTLSFGILWESFDPEFTHSWPKKDNFDSL